MTKNEENLYYKGKYEVATKIIYGLLAFLLFIAIGSWVLAFYAPNSTKIENQNNNIQSTK